MKRMESITWALAIAILIGLYMFLVTTIWTSNRTVEPAPVTITSSEAREQREKAYSRGYVESICGYMDRHPGDEEASYNCGLALEEHDALYVCKRNLCWAELR